MVRLLARLRGRLRSRRARGEAALSAGQAARLRENLRSLLFSKEALADRRESAA